MVIADMHYGVKEGLNRQDSSAYVDLLIPQIDMLLNEAQEVYVKMVANPRYAKQVGFEIGQRTIDDIKTIVVDQKYSDGIAANTYDTVDNSYFATLPTDYWYYVGSNVYATKGDFKAKMRRVLVIQHNDEQEQSVFYKSSFNWREINVVFSAGGLVLYTDGTFAVEKVCFKYLKKPAYMHNAIMFNGDNGYYRLDGELLQGTQDCILPETAHRDIVDLAVFLGSMNLNKPDIITKQKRLGLTN